LRQIIIRRLKAFIRLGRPLFLAGGIIMHALGVALALHSGASLNIAALLWGQIAISATQWMTHYANDYFDLSADHANTTPTNWSGGSRVLTQGLLLPRVALVMALVLVCIVILAAFVLAFVVQTGALTIPMLSLALFLAWFYSAPPLRLHSTRLGTVLTAMLIAGLTPLTGFYLQSGRLELMPMLAIAPLMCLQFCMLLAVDFPDVAGDTAAGKRTLVVRLGAERAARLYSAVLVLAYLILPLLVIAGVPSYVALTIMLMSPIALWLLWCVRRGDYADPERWNHFSFYSIALLFGTASVETLTFLLLAGL
jgi:1,4-dihydroxy-2-naphthoate polyprenyltransferase